MLVRPKAQASPGIWLDPDLLVAVIPTFRQSLGGGMQHAAYSLVLRDGRAFEVSIEVGEQVLAASNLA